jgi:hypothetical protein
MSVNRTIGLELRDGHNVGRDPRHMPHDELAALGHAAMSPLKALRLRCIDCSGGSANEVRLCTAMQCPAWPFRMGSNRGARRRARRGATRRGLSPIEGPFWPSSNVQHVTAAQRTRGPLSP